MGNTILDDRKFETNTKTVNCSVAHEEVLGWSVTVVDTPGWSVWFGLSNPERVRKEMRRSLSLCRQGSKKAFVLAIPVDSFRESDRKAVEEYLKVLEEQERVVWNRTVVLFTYGEQLSKDTLEEYIEKMGAPLRWVLDRCGRRCCIMDTKTAEDADVTQLLQMVQRL